ncbi:MAG: hypothetical protein LAP87_16330 [Acidobacteriia bacterium]|nr:hypothetical protein [Terriglobia bacterium]
MMWATAAFLIGFLLISSSSRATLGGWLGNASKWIGDWAPFSYVIILLVIAASIVPVVLMARWPRREDPVNPMARYKDDEVLPD